MELTSEHRQIKDFIKKQLSDSAINLFEDTMELYPNIPWYQIAIAIACEFQIQAITYLSAALGKLKALDMLQAFILAKKAQLDGTNVDGLSTFLQQARNTSQSDPTT